LERRLANRPVAAGPPSRLYRFRKLVARNRLAVGSAALLLLALVGFGAAMAVQARRLAIALKPPERGKKGTERVSDFLVEILEQPDPTVAHGQEPTLRQVLERGAARVARELADQPELQARLLETIGRVDLNLGQFDAAEPPVKEALELRRKLRGSV